MLKIWQGTRCESVVCVRVSKIFIHNSRTTRIVKEVIRNTWTRVKITELRILYTVIILYSVILHYSGGLENQIPRVFKIGDVVSKIISSTVVILHSLQISRSEQMVIDTCV